MIYVYGKCSVQYHKYTEVLTFAHWKLKPSFDCITVETPRKVKTQFAFGFK